MCLTLCQLASLAPPFIRTYPPKQNKNAPANVHRRAVPLTGATRCQVTAQTVARHLQEPGVGVLPGPQHQVHALSRSCRHRLVRQHPQAGVSRAAVTLPATKRKHAAASIIRNRSNARPVCPCVCVSACGGDREFDVQGKSGCATLQCGWLGAGYAAPHIRARRACDTSCNPLPFHPQPHLNPGFDMLCRA